MGTLGYAGVGPLEPSAPFANIEVRMEPINLLSVPRSTEPRDPEDPKRRQMILGRGGNFEDFARKNLIPPEAIARLLADLGAKKGETLPADGKKLILEYGDTGVQERTASPVRVTVYVDEQKVAEVALDDNGQYVSAKSSNAEGEAKRTASKDTGFTRRPDLISQPLRNLP